MSFLRLLDRLTPAAYPRTIYRLRRHQYFNGSWDSTNFESTILTTVPSVPAIINEFEIGEFDVHFYVSVTDKDDLTGVASAIIPRYSPKDSFIPMRIFNNPRPYDIKLLGDIRSIISSDLFLWMNFYGSDIGDDIDTWTANQTDILKVRSVNNVKAMEIVHPGVGIDTEVYYESRYVGRYTYDVDKDFGNTFYVKFAQPNIRTDVGGADTQTGLIGPTWLIRFDNNGEIYLNRHFAAFTMTTDGSEDTRIEVVNGGGGYVKLWVYFAATWQIDATFDFATYTTLASLRTAMDGVVGSVSGNNYYTDPPYSSGWTQPQRLAYWAGGVLSSETLEDLPLDTGVPQYDISTDVRSIGASGLRSGTWSEDNWIPMEHIYNESGGTNDFWINGVTINDGVNLYRSTASPPANKKIYVRIYGTSNQTAYIHDLKCFTRATDSLANQGDTINIHGISGTHARWLAPMGHALSEIGIAGNQLRKSAIVATSWGDALKRLGKSYNMPRITTGWEGDYDFYHKNRLYAITRFWWPTLSEIQEVVAYLADTTAENILMREFDPMIWGFFIPPGSFIDQNFRSLANWLPIAERFKPMSTDVSLGYYYQKESELTPDHGEYYKISWYTASYSAAMTRMGWIYRCYCFMGDPTPFGGNTLHIKRMVIAGDDTPATATAPTVTDWELESATKISLDTQTGLINLDYAYIHPISGVWTNTTGSTFYVKEVGLYLSIGPNYPDSDPWDEPLELKHIMIARFIFDGPEVILAGNTYTLNYTHVGWGDGSTSTTEGLTEWGTALINAHACGDLSMLNGQVRACYIAFGSSNTAFDKDHYDLQGTRHTTTKIEEWNIETDGNDVYLIIETIIPKETSFFEAYEIGIFPSSVVPGAPTWDVDHSDAMLYRTINHYILKEEGQAQLIKIRIKMA